MLALQAPVRQGPPRPELRLQVGEVTVLVDRKYAALGTALAEVAERPRNWLGLGRLDLGPLVLVMAADTAAFGGWSNGRVPSWGAGLTLPGSRLVVIRVDGGDPSVTLWHELAHVALHQQIVGRVPLWFDEGYAVLAAGEFGRIAGLQLNLSVASGRIPTLGALDRNLRGSSGDAEEGYALAGSAVAYLARLNPTRTLGPLLERLKAGMPFEEAIKATTGMSPDRFDEAWQRDVRKSHNWLIWLVTGGAWLIVTLMLGWAVAWRRRRDAPRREALNIGWEIAPLDDDEITTFREVSAPLDPPDSDR